MRPSKLLLEVNQIAELSGMVWNCVNSRKSAKLPREALTRRMPWLCTTRLP